MDFFKKLGEKLGLIEEDKTAKINAERSMLKLNLASKLKNINFTEQEINEVLDILTKMEAEVQIQKDLLIGTNINNPDPTIIMKEVLDEIRRLEVKAGEDIKAKIAEIRERKKSNS